MEISKKLRIWSILMLLFVSTTIFAQEKCTKDSKDKITGEWTFTAPEAPYGYQEGTITFSQKEGKLIGNVKTGSSSFTIGDIKYDKTKKLYLSSFYADGADVDMSLKETDCNNLNGSADAQGTSMTVKCKRVNPCKSAK